MNQIANAMADAQQQAGILLLYVVSVVDGNHLVQGEVGLGPLPQLLACLMPGLGEGASHFGKSGGDGGNRLAQGVDAVGLAGVWGGLAVDREEIDHGGVAEEIPDLLAVDVWLACFGAPRGASTPPDRQLGC